MPAPRSAPVPGLAGLLAVLAALAVAAGLAGCSRGDFADRTALVELRGRTTSYQVDSCGLDGTTLFVVGRTPDGRVLQAVVGVEDDQVTGVPRSTGVTVTDGSDELAAFGAESWERRGESGRPPGRVSSARRRGSRIQVAGGLEVVDAEGRPTPATAEAAETEPFTLDARCDEVD